MPDPRPIPYHQQDRDKYCGPAVVMMILDAIGGQALQQDPLHTLLGDGDNVWATRPDDLLRVLNACAGRPTPPDTFSRLPGSKVDQVSLGIARRAVAKFPTATLVFGEGHWVVVTGANVAPGAAGSVLGFFVNSPSLTPEQPPYQHTVDDKCGSNRAYGGLEANQYVSYDGWKTDFFTGFEDQGGTEFVAISGAVAEETPLSFSTIVPRPVLQRMKTGAICPQDASDRGIAGADLHRLQDGPLRDAFLGVTYGTPQLVQRLFGYSGPYYLIPAVRDGKSVGVVRVDGYTGMFLGAAPVKDGQIATLLSEMETFVRTDTSESRKLYWQPSQQSRSPFEPFLKIVAQGGGVTFLDAEMRPFDHPIPLRSGWRRSMSRKRKPHS